MLYHCISRGNPARCASCLPPSVCLKHPSPALSGVPLQNAMVEMQYPPERYRDDVGLLWYADVSVEDGTLRQLSMSPMRLRCNSIG